MAEAHRVAQPHRANGAAVAVLNDLHPVGARLGALRRGDGVTRDCRAGDLRARRPAPLGANSGQARAQRAVGADAPAADELIVRLEAVEGAVAPKVVVARLAVEQLGLWCVRTCRVGRGALRAQAGAGAPY